MHEDQLETEILSVLVEGEPLDVTEIAREVDDHPLTVERVCNRLHDDSCIYTLWQGRYEATNRGERRFAGEHDREQGSGSGSRTGSGSGSRTGSGSGSKTGSGTVAESELEMEIGAEADS